MTNWQLNERRLSTIITKTKNEIKINEDETCKYRNKSSFK